jgi:hypothetical protein
MADLRRLFLNNYVVLAQAAAQSCCAVQLTQQVFPGEEVLGPWHQSVGEHGRNLSGSPMVAYFRYRPKADGFNCSARCHLMI